MTRQAQASRRHVVAVLLLSSVLHGCAGTARSVSADGTSIVCHKESPTGSSIPVTKCRTLEQIERDRAAAQSTGDDINRARSGLRGPATQ